MQLPHIIEDFHQAIPTNRQKVTFSLLGINNDEKQFKTLFKNRAELIESINILYKKCESDNLTEDKKVEQTMRFFKTSDNALYCRTLIFSNGRQRSQKSEIWSVYETFNNAGMFTSDKDTTLPYEIQLYDITETQEQTINDCTSMISEIKFQLYMQDWCLSIVLVKQWGLVGSPTNKILGISERYHSKSLNIHKLKEIKSRLLNSEFTVDNFIKKVPYTYADIIKIDMEYCSGAWKHFDTPHIIAAVKLLENGLIDACRICPQDIYLKVAAILKVPSEEKYKSGEYGIKQLTSRVITLDHDILHKELIPDFKNYAVSEKTNGTTSIVMIADKNIFIACGNIVYKFEVYTFPVLPSSKNIEILKLNRNDLNNIWIFDAEVIINTGENLTLIPFDIRMASSINVDNINFKYRLMFINGLASLKANKVQIKIKKWYKSSDIKLLYDNANAVIPNAVIPNVDNIIKIDIPKPPVIKSDVDKNDGFIFAYLESLNFTVSMYYANKIWKWKPSMGGLHDNNTIDFLIQDCPNSLKGKFPYISGGKKLYVLCCGLNKATHQSLPNIIVVQSLIPSSAIEYLPALFTPSDKPYSHLFWSEDQTDLHGQIGEFIYNKAKNEWSLIKIRIDRRIEVARGNYYGNDHRTAESNWFMMNNPLTLDELFITNSYTNQYMSKYKFLHAIYESLVKNVISSNETVINISNATIMESFNKFPLVVYVYKNKIEANRYIKDKYELTKKKIRFNSYYLLLNSLTDIKTEIKNSSIPVSNHGFDNLIMIYHDLESDVPGFDSINNGLKSVEFYESLISKNGKIIIVLKENSNQKIENIIKAFEAARFRKPVDLPINKWVYIIDVDLYQNTRVLVFTRAPPTELINFIIPT